MARTKQTAVKGATAGKRPRKTTMQGAKGKGQAKVKASASKVAAAKGVEKRKHKWRPGTVQRRAVIKAMTKGTDFIMAKANVRQAVVNAIMASAEAGVEDVATVRVSRGALFAIQTLWEDLGLRILRRANTLRRHMTTRVRMTPKDVVVALRCLAEDRQCPPSMLHAAEAAIL